jgi:hypothetical protein
MHTAGSMAFLELLEWETTNQQWLFPQEKATLNNYPSPT